MVRYTASNLGHNRMQQCLLWDN
uniref:Uncharacterized protein n=1 Tax=Rhizophora mucronata TaxID=61149 RepID=A0A2P2P161_RHIMU